MSERLVYAALLMVGSVGLFVLGYAVGRRLELDAREKVERAVRRLQR